MNDNWKTRPATSLTENGENFAAWAEVNAKITGAIKPAATPAASSQPVPAPSKPTASTTKSK